MALAFQKDLWAFHREEGRFVWRKQANFLMKERAGFFAKKLPLFKEASLFEENGVLVQADSSRKRFWGSPRMLAEVKMSMGESMPCG